MISDYAWRGPGTGMSQLGSKPQTNALAEMASNPVTAAYNEMFGGTDAGSDGGVSSGVNSGVSEGTTPGKSVSTKNGWATDYDYSTGKNVASVAGKAASVLGAPMGVGTALSALGVGYDQYQANQELAARQTPTLGVGDYFSALANDMSFDLFGTKTRQAALNNYQDYWGPNGYDDMASFGYSAFSPYGGMGFDDPGAGYGFDDFGPVGTMGFDDAQPEGFAGFEGTDKADKDDFGGWGGYDGDKNDGPGADAEGEGW